MSSASSAPIRALTLTTLFPNAVEPSNGIFVEQRLRHLAASGRVEARVVAPVPWFPSRAPIFGRYAGFARVPPRETRFGIPVEHPRYGLLPKIGLPTARSCSLGAHRRRCGNSSIRGSTAPSSTRTSIIPTASPRR